MNTHELAFLKVNHVKPVCWRLTRIDKGYALYFNYTGPDSHSILVGDKITSPWSRLYTQRGEPKIYKTTDAALSDVWEVDPHAVVYTVAE